MYGYLDRVIIEREADLLNGSCRAHASGNSEAESAEGAGPQQSREEHEGCFCNEKNSSSFLFFWFHRGTFKHVD